MERRHAFPYEQAADPRPGTVVANLQRWGRGWVADTHRWEPIRLDSGQLCNGFAMEYGRTFAAVFTCHATVWMHLGERAWDCTDVVRVIQRSESVRTSSYDLVFADGGQEQVTLRMPAEVVAHRLIDPTYDELDSSSDDIMKLLPYVATDGWRADDADVQAWVRRVQPLWESGIKHST